MSGGDILTGYAGGERLTHSIHRSGWRGAFKLGASITSSRYRGTTTGVLGGGVIGSGTTS